LKRAERVSRRLAIGTCWNELAIQTRIVVRIDNPDWRDYDSAMGMVPLSDPDASALPPGYKGIRGELLVELKRAPGTGARDLATRLGVSLTALRHHLKELESAQVVRHELLHQGVGAPSFVYRLTERGEALFPRRYGEALTQVLHFVAEREGRPAAVRLLEAHFDALRERVRLRLAAVASPEPAARMAAVAEVLSEAGYMAEGTATSCCGTLVERNCALHEVAERFPEICALETRMLADTLEGTIERRTHILSGCGACEYKVRFAGHAGADPGPEEIA
jgi:DeoR family transcriptional regulator, suf operon transcriptional repressor